LPTLLTASGVASLNSRKHLPLDGLDQWACILGEPDATCPRQEVVLNINTVCDPESASDDGGAGGGVTKQGVGSGSGFATECPAPKAALRVGELKLLVECYNASTHAFTGALQLYNLSADRSEQHDLSAAMPTDVGRLSARLLKYAQEAAQVPPLGDEPPWQGAGYYCADCTVGRPVGTGDAASWEPWCEGDAGVPC
jgi:hypothetical protein